MYSYNQVETSSSHLPVLHGAASKSFFSSSWQNKSSVAPVNKCIMYIMSIYTHIYIYPRCQFWFLQMSFKCHETSKYIKLPCEFRVALITAWPLRSSPDHVAACCHPPVNTGRRHRSKMTTPSTVCATKWTEVNHYDLLTLSHTVLDFWLCTSWHRILHHSRVNS